MDRPRSTIRRIVFIAIAVLLTGLFPADHSRRPFHPDGGFLGNLVLLALFLIAFFAATLFAGVRSVQHAVLGSHRRARGMCPSCAYDRQGLAPDAVCPECGGRA